MPNWHVQERCLAMQTFPDPQVHVFWPSVLVQVECLFPPGPASVPWGFTVGWAVAKLAVNIAIRANVIAAVRTVRTIVVVNTLYMAFSLPNYAEVSRRAKSTSEARLCQARPNEPS